MFYNVVYVYFQKKSWALKYNRYTSFLLLKTNESSKVICENETLMRGEVTRYLVETPLLFESIKIKIYEILINSTFHRTDDSHSYEDL